METRRRFLTAISATSITALTGCSQSSGENNPNTDTEISEATETVTEETTEQETTTTEEERTTTREPAAYKQEVPVDFPLYIDRLEQVDEEGVPPEISTDQIINILDGKTGIEAAKTFIEETTDQYGNLRDPDPSQIYAATKKLYQTKAQNPDANLPDLAVNVNYAFTGDSGPAIEIHPVQQNKKLHLPPVILHSNDIVYKNAKGLRNSSDSSAMMAYDVEALKEGVEIGREKLNTSEENIRDFREYRQKKMSNAIFGVEGNPDLIFLDNTLFDAVHNPIGDSSAEKISELNRDVEEYVDSDEIIGIAYEEGVGWRFEQLEDFEYGDPMPEPSEVL